MQHAARSAAYGRSGTHTPPRALIALHRSRPQQYWMREQGLPRREQRLGGTRGGGGLGDGGGGGLGEGGGGRGREGGGGRSTLQSRMGERWRQPL